MNSEVKEYFDVLLDLCEGDMPLRVAYRQLRELLERLCRTRMGDGHLQMTDLSARISFVAAKAGLSIVEQNRLHTVRLTSNKVLNGEDNVSRSALLRDAKTLAFCGDSACRSARQADEGLFPVCRRDLSVCTAR